MSAIAGYDSIHNPRYNPFIEKTKLRDLSSLTFEQTAVLDEVKNIIAGLGESGVKVQVTVPQLQENGMTISVRGFMSSGIYGTGDYSLGLDELEKMAADEKYKKEMLAKIKMDVDEQKRSKAEYSKLPQSTPVQIPVTFMDFWNDDKEKKKSLFTNYYSQAMQTLAGKYEMNFCYK